MRIILTLVVALAWLTPAYAAPPCIPGLYGKQFPGSNVHPLVRGDAGWYGWGWCTNTDGSPYPVYRLCAHGECVSDLGAAVGRVAAGAGVTALTSGAQPVYGALWDANPKAYSCDADPRPTAGTPQAAACAELLSLMAADKPAWTAPTPPPPPPPPPAETWVVQKATSTANPPGTRPTYFYTPPATLQATGQRITEGSACNCSAVKYSTSTSTYCAVTAAPVTVAACVKVSP